MGISGLLPFLKQYRSNVTLDHYSGQTAAVDVSCWIHQGAYYADFSEGIESAIQKIIHYVTKKIRMLLEHKITPIVVFDGAGIPIKSIVREDRARRRIICREKITLLLKEGKPDEANKKFGESFTITPYLVQRILKSVRGIGCRWIIAPYEADAQLTYLFKTGKADVVMTEDSDLLAYGVTKIMYKIDQEGEGFELDMNRVFGQNSDISDKLHGSQDSSEGTKSQENEVAHISGKSKDVIDFDIPTPKSVRKYSGSPKNTSFKDDAVLTSNNFLKICILAGWDYMESVKGIGFITAWRLVTKHVSIEKVIKSIKSMSKYSMPLSYLKNYHAAYMTFLYQIVYDYETEECVNLTFPDKNDFYGKMFLELEDSNFCGEVISKEFAKKICEGEVDIETKESIDIEKLKEDFKITNDPFTTQLSSESDEATGATLKEIFELENKPILKKKTVSAQKKIWFKPSASKKSWRRIPSPFKSKIAGNLKNLPFIKELTKTDAPSKGRRRTFKQMKLLDMKKDDSSDSEIEDDLHSSSLLGLFKRAKKQEDGQTHVGVFIPKLQTIKKKTFMRSLVSSKPKF